MSSCSRLTDLEMPSLKSLNLLKRGAHIAAGEATGIVRDRLR
jgi:hypothetical protein